jgi:branched-chain amino acid transport system permease protein
VPRSSIILVITFTVIALIAIPFVVGPSRYISALVNQALYFSIAVLSLNLIIGIAGQVSLGHAGFIGIGAYAYALLVKFAMLPPLIALVAGILAGGIAGVIVGVPALRMRGPYVVLGTMAFGEMVRLTLAMGDWAGGVDGLVGIPGFKIANLDHGTAMYILLVLALLASIGLIEILQRSYLGKVLVAIKDDEMAANAAGIDVNAAKIVAFGLSGAIAALGGTLYAATYAVISPDVFDINLSLLILTMLILGGMGRTSGVVAGAVLLTFLPEMLRFSANVYMIIYAALVILLAIFMPGGIVGFLSDLLPRTRISR